jgi:plastocyanin
MIQRCFESSIVAGVSTGGEYIWYTLISSELSKEVAMKNTGLGVLIVLISALMFGTNLYGEETKQPATDVAPAATTDDHSQGALKEKRVVATVDADGVQRVEITGGGYFFDPNYIVVKVNVPVELKVKKEGGYTPHNIVVKAPEAGINFDESLGKEPKIINFTPKTIGKYEMYCSKKLPFVKSHKDRGMDGMIEVVQ